MRPVSFNLISVVRNHIELSCCELDFLEHSISFPVSASTRALCKVCGKIETCILGKDNLKICMQFSNNIFYELVEEYFL